MTTTPRKELETLLDGLKQQRDELMVQLHLAKAEARDEWEELEKNWSICAPKPSRPAASRAMPQRRYLPR